LASLRRPQGDALPFAPGSRGCCCRSPAWWRRCSTPRSPPALAGLARPRSGYAEAVAQAPGTGARPRPTTRTDWVRGRPAICRARSKYAAFDDVRLPAAARPGKTATSSSGGSGGLEWLAEEARTRSMTAGALTIEPDNAWAAYSRGLRDPGTRRRGATGLRALAGVGAKRCGRCSTTARAAGISSMTPLLRRDRWCRWPRTVGRRLAQIAGRCRRGGGQAPAGRGSCSPRCAPPEVPGPRAPHFRPGASRIRRRAALVKEARAPSARRSPRRLKPWCPGGVLDNAARPRAAGRRDAATGRWLRGLGRRANCPGSGCSPRS